MKIPPRSVVVGNPAKIVKQVSDEMLEWKSKGTALYQTLPEDLKKTMKAVKPSISVNGRPIDNRRETEKSFITIEGPKSPCITPPR